MESKIAIVIPAHNRAALIERTLDSVAEQTYRPLRLILVDNNSTDDTLEIMRRWADEHRADDFAIDILSEPKPGATAARNTGLAAVQEEWTMFFDSDDTMMPGHVERAMRCVDSRPDAGIVGWDIEMVDDRGKATTHAFAQFDMMFHCVMHGAMATLRYMARTSLFRMAGGWREDVAVWNDIELGARLLQLFAKGKTKLAIMKAMGPKTVRVYVHGDSITGTGFSQKGREREHAIDCIEATLDPSQKCIASLKRAILAGNYDREGRSDMADALMAKTSGNLLRRAACRLARWQTARGIRGAARLLRPLF